MKCKAFKAKSVGMVVNGSVIDAGGATVSSRGLRWLVDCLVSFLSSEDWAAEESRSRSLGEVSHGGKE